MGECRQGAVEFRQQTLAGAEFLAQVVLLPQQGVPQPLGIVQRAAAFRPVDGFQRYVEPAQGEGARELPDLFRPVVAIAVVGTDSRGDEQAERIVVAQGPGRDFEDSRQLADGEHCRFLQRDSGRLRIVPGARSRGLRRRVILTERRPSRPGPKR